MSSEFDRESLGVMGAVTRVVRGDAAPKGEIVWEVDQGGKSGCKG